LGFVVGILA
jgi:serine carboxypeptidase-like clade 2